MVQTRPITALFAGHTHYGQMAKDGRNLYVATRSIGDPEGGPAGSAIAHLDGEGLATTYFSIEDRGPVALITHPRHVILATKPAHIITGGGECRVRGWSGAEIKSAEGRIDDGAWDELRKTGDMTWSCPIPGDTLSKGEHSLEVRLADDQGFTGSDRLTFACDLSGRYNAYPMVEPVVKETKFC